MYQRPHSIGEAVTALAEAPSALLLNGGTDVYPAHVGRTILQPVIDLSAARDLRAIAVGTGEVRIGGGATWTDIARAPLPPAFDGLRAAAREVGSLQIQNRGTIGGNLCNASPAADGVPPLLALDARVELASARGRRELPLGEFITGYRQTARGPDEILSAVIVPVPAPSSRSSFVKLGARRYLVISILMAAALVERDAEGRIARAAVAVGAASPVAQRLPALEEALRGLDAGKLPSAVLRPDHLAELSPITDVRATAGYRLSAAMDVVAEALDRAAGAWRG